MSSASSESSSESLPSRSGGKVSLLSLVESVLLRTVDIVALVVLRDLTGGGGLGVLVVSTCLIAEFVSGGGANDVGGSSGSTLAAARVKISCVERFSMRLGSVWLDCFSASETEKMYVRRRVPM